MATSGNDPRGRQQNLQQYLQGQRESYYGPYMQEAYTNMGRGNQQGWQDYGNISSGYDQIMGLGPSSNMQPRQPTSNTMPVQGGGGMQGGMDPQQAYEQASRMIDPNASKEEMEAGLTEAYKNVPGFEQAYKESVKINGQWYDLVEGYGAQGAKWGGFRPKGPDTGSSAGGQQGGMSTFGEFATTGGYSPEDMNNMRARGVSPVRAAYENAEREVKRNRSLQGGYSPNMAPTLAKMARERGQAGADAATNVEASLATMKNQGKQFGLSGMQGSLAGKTGLYGSTPGMANMFGSQALNAANQSAGHGISGMNAATSAQQLPGQWDTNVNRAGTLAGIGGNILKAARGR